MYERYESIAITAAHIARPDAHLAIVHPAAKVAEQADELEAFPLPPWTTPG